jgi:hypothetical protein
MPATALQPSVPPPLFYTETSENAAANAIHMQTPHSPADQAQKSPREDPSQKIVPRKIPLQFVLHHLQQIAIKTRPIPSSKKTTLTIPQLPSKTPSYFKNFIYDQLTFRKKIKTGRF